MCRIICSGLAEVCTLLCTILVFYVNVSWSTLFLYKAEKHLYNLLHNLVILIERPRVSCLSVCNFSETLRRLACVPTTHEGSDVCIYVTL